MSTKMSSTKTGLGGCWATASAAACGWKTTLTCTTMEQVAALRLRLRREVVFAVIRISAADVPRFLPPRDAAALSVRFRQALGIAPD